MWFGLYQQSESTTLACLTFVTYTFIMRAIIIHFFDKFPDCAPLNGKDGQLLSCLMDYQENITNPQCKQFLTKMESIVFADYRLIYQFTDRCESDIIKFKCGRMDKNDVSASQLRFEYTFEYKHVFLNIRYIIF